jgi:hypothetical protein
MLVLQIRLVLRMIDPVSMKLSIPLKCIWSKLPDQLYSAEAGSGRITIRTGSLDLLYRCRCRSTSSRSFIESGRTDSDDLDLVLWRRLDFQNSVSGIDRTRESIS